MKLICSILSIAAFLSVGCNDRPDELEQKSFQLTNGLTITGVSNLFSGFPKVPVEENGNFTPAKVTRCFQTNQTCAKTLMYRPKKNPGNDPLWFEWCEIWFDTNGVIVAYEYQIGD